MTGKVRKVETDGVTHWEWDCDRCGNLVTRHRGHGDVQCWECDAQYNAGGQRLRDDWRGNMSNWDEDVSDMDGFEMQQLAQEDY